MSCLKMYFINPTAKNIPLPAGFTVTRFQSEADIEPWLWICRDGLIAPEAGIEKFRGELMELDGPDPCRDTYFIEKDGQKIATYTVVPDMWSTGMGYIHMVACRSEFRGLGLGRFMADDAIRKLIALQKQRLFLLTGDARLPALRTYISAGFLPVNYIDEEGKDMVQRWQNVVNSLGLDSLDLLNDDGSFMQTLYKTV